MKKLHLLFVLITLCVQSTCYSMYECPPGSTLLFIDDESPRPRQLDKQFRSKALEIIHDKDLDPEERKKACSELLYKIVDRGPHGECSDIVELLLQNGADPNIKHEEAALSLAVVRNSKNNVRLLLDHKADPNIRDKGTNRTPLTEALEMGRDLEMIQLLVDHGANPNLVDSDNSTTLIRAVSKNGLVFLKAYRKQIVYLLLGHGADPNQKPRGKSAIEIAQENGFYDLVEIMRIYPNVYSLKDLCFKYIKQNISIFKDKLDTLPAELFDQLVEKLYKDAMKADKVCAACKKENSTKKCGQCKKVYYCSRECQQENWPAHKLICRE
jgi:ankyrin repeat protein